MTEPRLVDDLKPCGPIVDPRAAARTQEQLREVADSAGWGELLTQAWPALAPVFGASSYLAGLVRRDPERLRRLLEANPDDQFNDLIERTLVLGEANFEVAKPGLRILKAEAHLLIALADLGGVWDLDAVTGALTRFADAALQASLAVAARVEISAGRLRPSANSGHGPVPGFFCIAMGKHGAFELNYSSDIDISIFYEPDGLLLMPEVESQAFAVRLTHLLVELMADRTSEGYVFRVDLRLRPDPSSTPPAMPVPAALEYYESVGQNWERAAYIKARPCAGDIPAAIRFLEALQPFIWRRNLDFAAIADIHAIKRQIHIHKVDDRLTAKGIDLKLGRGGIREIEFYVQTQQLILGGRRPELRSPRTLVALQALHDGGHVSERVLSDLTLAYEQLRGLEHRIQMLADEQTHRLPEADGERRRVAALIGFERLRSFDSTVERTLKTVNRRYGELFSDEETLSSRFGSLVFTGVEDDPETLATLARMGFSNPSQIAQTIRDWHHGHIAATRSARGRELFTRLAPRLLDAAQATGSAEIAFRRFADFFENLSSGVQLQSLFLAQPALFELLVRVMAYAPRLARTLAQQPAAIDAMLDGDFQNPISETLVAALPAISEADFEVALDFVRRRHREQVFRIGVQVMSATLGAQEAGQAFADLADSCITTLAPVALAEVERVAGQIDGHVAVIALGKCGSREMSAGSDLDLMTVYQPQSAESTSAIKAWTADVFFARFTQRFIAALSTPTREGRLYDVDMQLRPSGTKGPVAVSLTAFEDYYAGEAETWELLALTRARVVWASDPMFAKDVARRVEAVLRKPRLPAQTARDVQEMRALMTQERPSQGWWDLKLCEGGLVDIEFAIQYLQLVHAPEGGPLRTNTAEALGAYAETLTELQSPLSALQDAWRIQQDLTQILKLALTDRDDPDDQPKGFRQMLVRVGGARDIRGLKGRLDRARIAAHKAFETIVQP